MIAKATPVAPDQQALGAHQQCVTEYRVAISVSADRSELQREVERRRWNLIESCKALLRTLEQ